MLVSMLDFWGLTGRGLAHSCETGVNLPDVVFPISPQPLHLSPTLKHLLKEQKISYPMHVSGHGMVEWLQRYACAKLSETIWLAGG